MWLAQIRVQPLQSELLGLPHWLQLVWSNLDIILCNVTHDHWYVSDCTITTGQIFVVKFEDKILWITNDCENHKIVSLKTLYWYGTCLRHYQCYELELVDTVQMYISRLKLLSISRWCFLYSLQALVVELYLSVYKVQHFLILPLCIKVMYLYLKYTSEDAFVWYAVTFSTDFQLWLLLSYMEASNPVSVIHCLFQSC